MAWYDSLAGAIRSIVNDERLRTALYREEIDEVVQEVYEQLQAVPVADKLLGNDRSQHLSILREEVLLQATDAAVKYSDRKYRDRQWLRKLSRAGL